MNMSVPTQARLEMNAQNLAAEWEERSGELILKETWTVLLILRARLLYLQELSISWSLGWKETLFLRGGMGEISNFYNFSPRLFSFWHTYSSYNTYTCCKVSLMSLTYFLPIFKIYLLAQTLSTRSRIFSTVS